MERTKGHSNQEVVIRMEEEIKGLQAELEVFRKEVCNYQLEACIEQRRREIIELVAGYHSECREYLFWNALRAESMDELEEKEEEYFDFQESKYKKLQEEIGTLRELKLGLKRYNVW